MASFLDALTPLVDACDALGIAYYIGGSVASIAHGVPRTTLDVDVIADIRPGHVRQLVARSNRRSKRLALPRNGVCRSVCNE
jgi:hypothetical protein